MNPTRRQFAALAAAATAAAAGCSRRTETKPTASTPATSPSEDAGAVDAGSLADYDTDDVYDKFRQEGFFVIRRDETLFALSSICTHKGCKVRVQEDRSFACKCHGSRFDKDGHVTKGPAKRDLPRLSVAMTSDQHVLVNVRPQEQPRS